MGRPAPTRIHARYDGVADRVVLYFGGVTWQQDRDAFARLGEVARAVSPAR